MLGLDRDAEAHVQKSGVFYTYDIAYVQENELFCTYR